MDNAEFQALQKRRTKLGQELAVAERDEQVEMDRLKDLLKDAKASYGTTDLKELRAKAAEMEAARDASLARASEILDELEAK